MHTALILIASFSLAATIFAGIAAYVSSESYFSRLVASHPELSDEFPKPGFNTKYGPIRPSYMNYVKEKRHLQLPEAELRHDGDRVLKYLYVHATSFTLFILSVLLLGYTHGA